MTSTGPLSPSGSASVVLGLAEGEPAYRDPNKGNRMPEFCQKPVEIGMPGETLSMNINNTTNRWLSTHTWTRRATWWRFKLTEEEEVVSSAVIYFEWYLKTQKLLKYDKRVIIFMSRCYNKLFIFTECPPGLKPENGDAFKYRCTNFNQRLNTHTSGSVDS